MYSGKTMWLIFSQIDLDKMVVPQWEIPYKPEILKVLTFWIKKVIFLEQVDMKKRWKRESFGVPRLF